MVLFSRLILLMQRNNDITNYFAYELAPVPTSLFKDNMMRKPTKSALAKGLDAECEKYANKEEVYVSDTIDAENQSDTRVRLVIPPKRVNCYLSYRWF